MMKTTKINENGLYTYAPVRVEPMVATIVYVDERDEEIDRTDYTDIKKFNQDLMDELRWGTPMAIVLYQNENGKVVVNVDDVEYLLRGVRIEEATTMVCI